MADWMFVAVIATLSIALVCGVLVWRIAQSNQQLLTRLEKLEQRLDQHQSKNIEHDEAFHEIRTGAIGVANRVKALDQLVAQLSSQVIELENLDPQTRRYSQAARMVESGATVEDLMAECELPRAEAELLLSLKK